MGAKQKKTNTGVIAVISIAVLCLFFPRSTWGYIVLAVGAIWAYRALFGSQKKHNSRTASTVSNKTGPATGQVDNRLSPVPPTALATQVPATPPPSSAAQVGGPPKRFVDDDIPIAVAARVPAAHKSFAIPPAPANLGPGRWIPQGESVVIAGSLIQGGMIYVGKTLKAQSNSPDPCLINPALPVAAQADASEREFGYWPSYSQISPTARRAYLNWLESGRSDPEADIGYVFLFFYGLERRSIVDAQKDEQAQLDSVAIAHELRRLLVIYGEKSFSFKRYASELLGWLEIAHYSDKLYNEPVPAFPTTFEIPLYIRLALGLAAVDGVPVPDHLALAWARLDPANGLRTPATRCAEQFDKLFLQRYTETFKPGLILPRNKTKLKFVYRPASAGFQSVHEVTLTFGNLPDVTVLTAPQKRLKIIVDTVTDELDPYSRYLGRNPDAPQALEGLLLLPPSLWPRAPRDALQGLQDRVASAMVVMTLQELLDTFHAKATLNKERAVALARTLESIHIGIEPDILGGARTPKGEDSIVLYAAHEPDGAQARTPGYLAATLTLQLASAVASADGEFGIHEMEHLREQVQAWTHLTPSQSTRLLAHLHLLVAEPVPLNTLKKKLEPLDTKSKQTIATFMASVAQADGTVTPAEVKMLERVYKTLGLESSKVFTDVHAVAAGTRLPAGAVAKTEVTGFQLDTARIAALQKDSDQVSALLADIFKEDTPPPASPAEATAVELPTVEAHPTSSNSGLFGLDESHSAFARMLLSRPQWSREELLDVASDLDLMLDGALERINEVSFDTHDVPFTEGDDPVDVNPEILEKLEA